MVDFSKLYSRPAGEAKRPPQMPAGEYPCIIKSFEFIESAQKKTPGVQYFVTLLDWPDGAPESWTETDDQGKKWEYSKDDIDLSKRQASYTFYIPVNEAGEPTGTTDWMFDEFFRSLGLEPSGRSYEELIPEAVGQRALLQMRKELNEQNNRITTRMTGIVGTNRA